MTLSNEIEKTHYTYTDYAKWETELKYELIDGIAYSFAAPSTNHQRISRKLTKQLDNYLEGKSCELFVAPFDIRLNSDTFDDTVIQPDLVVICDKSKLGKNSFNGVPDLIIEITSPSTISYDRVRKYNLYLKTGVKEYWIVDPESQTVNVFILDDKNYIGFAYEANDVIHSQVLVDCIVDLKPIFELEER